MWVRKDSWGVVVAFVVSGCTVPHVLRHVPMREAGISPVVSLVRCVCAAGILPVLF